MKSATSCIVAAMAAIWSTTAAAETSQVNLTGVAEYDPPELLSFAAQTVVQRHGTVTAVDLARAVQAIYREDGYFLAEVFVASDGRTLVVDEGRIGQIVIEGVDERTFRLIRSYMEPLRQDGAVTLDEFERAVMLVEDIEAISARVEIDYPQQSGDARVRIVATEEDRSFGALTLDHPARDFGGAATLSLSQQFLSMFTPGDMLRFELSGTADLDNGDNSIWGSVAYRMPLGGAGAYGEVYVGSVSASRDVRGALAATDIEGDTAILALGYPVIRNVDTYGYALIEVRKSGSFVDVTGTEFNSDVEVAGASWIFGKALSTGGAWEYAVNLSAGRRTSGAVGFDDGDEDFAHLRFGFGWEEPTGWFGSDTTIRAEVWGQYSPDRLPAIEEFYIGGREDERGYLFAEGQGDRGLSASFTVSRDLFPSAPSLKRLSPFGFVDIGYVSNNDPGAGEIVEETFASLGLGLDAEFGGDYFVRSYVAAPITDGPSTQAGDPAFYLGLTKTW